MHIAKLFYQSIAWKSGFFLSAFILNILIARHYQAAGSGHIFYLLNLYAFIILVAGLSLESSMGYFTARNEISTNKLISFSLAWAAATALGIFCFAIIMGINQQLTLTAIAFICGNILSNYCAGIAYAKRNFMLPNIINISINLMLTGWLLLMQFSQSSIVDDDTFITIFFCSMLLQGLISVFALGIKYPGTDRYILPGTVELKKLLHFAMVAFLANIISFLLYRIDYWFVKEYCDADDLGNYIQVSKLAQVFFILPGILAGTVFPLTASGERQKVNELLATLSRIIFMFYIFCCGILAAAGYWLFPFLFGDSFQNMYVPFLLLIPGILALSTLYTLTAYNAGKNKVSTNIKGAAIALVFIIVADLAFIPLYGINAAATITSIGYIIYHIYVLTVFTNEYRTPAISFFNFKLSDLQNIRNSIFKARNQNEQ